MPIIIFKNCYQLVIEEKGQHLKNMVFILPMLTHIIPIWIKDNLILMQSWIMIWLRCLRLCGIQNKIVNMDWNFIIAHVPIQKNMFCSNNFNFSQHLFLFLHDLLARIYTNVYHMFTYLQSWLYQTKRSAYFDFIKIIPMWAVTFQQHHTQDDALFGLFLSFIVR